MDKENKGYRLAPGTQVREEDFGLLFYTMAGPRLYFLYCADLLAGSFFSGRHTLGAWMETHAPGSATSAHELMQVEKTLRELARKGVVIEC